eukprot:Opistho-2@14604
MEVQEATYDPAEFIETNARNIVSRKTVLCGSQNIVLSGKTIVHADVIVRGDLAPVRIGQFCNISKGAVLRPSFKRFKSGYAFLPLQVGDYVVIGEGSVVNAASIGSCVQIGRNSVIGRRCIVRDCCRIEDGAVLAADTVFPAFSIVAGNPAVIVGELPETAHVTGEALARDLFAGFKPVAR